MGGVKTRTQLYKFIFRTGRICHFGTQCHSGFVLVVVQRSDTLTAFVTAAYVIPNSDKIDTCSLGRITVFEKKKNFHTQPLSMESSLFLQNQESKNISITSQNIPKTHRWRHFLIICGVGSMILQTLGPITVVLIHTIPTQSKHPDFSVIVLQTSPDHRLIKCASNIVSCRRVIRFV